MVDILICYIVLLVTGACYTEARYTYGMLHVSNKTVSPGYTATSEYQSSPLLCET